MNKTKKALMGVAALAMCGTMAFAIAGCGGNANKPVKVEDGVVTITIGNTAATTGAYASIGVPFNYGLEAWLWQYEQAHENIKFNFKHYDDGYDGAKGLQYTQQLVEQDKVFALVGHFGTNTIESTVDYISETGVPMVYAATGVNSLYNNNATGGDRAIMSVQPIYKTEGRSMLATAIAPYTEWTLENAYTYSTMGLGGTKVGCIYTTDDAGASIYAGVVEEATKLGVTVEYQSVDAAASDYSSAVNALKNKNCDIVIIASAQIAFAAIATQFVASNYDNVKILTSYVSANTSTMGGLVNAGVMTATRKVYSGAWLNVVDLTKPEQNYLSDETIAFATLMTTYGSTVKGWSMEADENGVIEAAQYTGNSFAMAGYVAGYTFTQGIDRLIAGKDKLTAEDFTWGKYIDAMESAPVTVALTQGATMDFSNGKRLGVTALSLIDFNAATAALGGTTVRALTSLEDIEKTINK